MEQYRFYLTPVSELLQIIADTENMDGPLKKINESAKGEISKRLHDRKNDLWQARVEVQKLENEIRELRGWPMIQIGGLTGDVEQ